MKRYLVFALTLFYLTYANASFHAEDDAMPRDGGDAVSPHKLSRSPSDADITKKEPAPQLSFNAPLPPPVGSTAGNSVGTLFGKSDDVVEALVDIGTREGCYKGCRSLLTILHGRGELSLRENPSPELRSWHTSYSNELKALAILVRFIYAQRPNLADANFTNCKTYTRDVLFMTVGVRVKSDRSLEEKVYNRPEDASRKWGDFFRKINEQFTGMFIFPNEECLVCASNLYKVGFRFPSAEEEVRSSRASSTVSAFAPEAATKKKEWTEQDIRDKWRVVAGNGIYSPLEPVSKLLQAISYSSESLRKTDFATIHAKWASQKADMNGLVLFLEDKSSDAPVLCRLALWQLCDVLDLTTDAAKARWDRYQVLAKKERDLFSKQGLRSFFADLFKASKTDPQVEIGNIELQSLLARLDEVQKDQARK